jgi:hypothetical protein
MWKKIIEFKNVLMAVVGIAVMSWSASSYLDNYLKNYTEAAEFKQLKNEFYDYKDYQRLTYLDKKILHYEMVHNCFEKGCMPPKMSVLTYETYDETLKERSRLKDKLNINKQEDQSP